MPTWKRILLRAFGFGIGSAVVLCLAVASWLWYTGRPKPPKPWNKQAIKAEFYRLDVGGEKNNFEFMYVLENRTDQDYRLDEGSSVSVGGLLKDTDSTQFDNTEIKPSYPIFIPSKQKTRIVITLPNYGFKEKLNDSATLGERQAYRLKVARYVNDELGNLNGFALFDETNRYEITMPAGWKTEATATQSDAK